MVDFSIEAQPEVFRSRTEISSQVSRAVQAGQARKIGPNLYTNNTTDHVEVIVHRNRWQIVSLLYPGTVVSYRTAVEGRPADDGTVFLTGNYNKFDNSLPGLTISMRKGPGPLEGDRQFVGELWIASRARQFLEVLKPSRSRKTVARGLERDEVETRLERLLQQAGSDALNALRDQARNIASALSATAELETLDSIIGTLLGTREAEISSPTAHARARGTPYDAACLDRMQSLFEELQQRVWARRPDACTGDDFRHLAFYDAYFSNYIEGTEFEIDEAAAIVFEGVIPDTRPDDAHDVLETYRLTSRLDVVGQSAAELPDADTFLDRLRTYHGEMLPQREEVRPGAFKDVPNMVGDTRFVDPDLVPETLRRGYELFRGLEDPFARAAFLSILITEVHPFRDGNGRVSRLMMNAELVSAAERRILVPIGYREDYLLALRAFSRQARIGPILEALVRVHQFTAEIDFSDWEEAQALLRACDAFQIPTRATLRLPSELGRATREPDTGERRQMRGR